MSPFPDFEPEALRTDRAGLPPQHDGAENESLRRTAAMAWLAGSSPMEAAPAGILDAVRLKVGLTGAAPAPVRRWRWRLAAVSGWAAALGMGLFLWNEHQRPSRMIVVSQPPPASGIPQTRPGLAAQPQPQASPLRRERPSTGPAIPSSVADTGAARRGAGNVGTVVPIRDAEAARLEIAAIREKMRRTRPPAAMRGVHQPVISELLPPGGESGTPSQERMLDIIATALEHDLQRRSGKPGRELVIESGWADWPMEDLPAETTFRHRTFPVARAQELGLLSGPEGQYLDPATNWLWSPEPGSTDYLGKAAPAGLDRAVFTAQAPPPPAEPKPVLAAASGYVVSDGTGDATIVALNNLPAVPEGGALEIVATDIHGETVQFGLPLDSASRIDGWSFSGLLGTWQSVNAGNFGQLLNYRVQLIRDPNTLSPVVLLETGSQPPLFQTGPQ